MWWVAFQRRARPTSQEVTYQLSLLLIYVHSSLHAIHHSWKESHPLPIKQPIDLSVEGGLEVAGNTALATMQAGNIAVGYIEATGCVDCTPARRRRRLAGSNESDHKGKGGAQRRRLAPSSAILYKTSDDEAEGEEERL